MEEQEQARIVGLALVRGLLAPDDLKRAAAEEGRTLLDALLAQGTLDDIDVEVLRGIPEASPGVPAPPPDIAPPAPGGPGEEGPEDGRAVRTLLALPAWKTYRNLVFLAEGGLGRVFRAFDPALKREVALKFLRHDDPGLARRFLLEAQHQARVEHPNICPVHEVGQWRGQAYFAMPFLEGETLEAAAPRLDLAEKVELLEIVAEAVHAAHRCGLVHRDLKPANIMVTRAPGEPPRPYVLDFGLARGLEPSDLTLQGTVIGTLHYMAPEQARCQTDRIGRRTDVFGLGATLFRILTGHLLHEGQGSLEDVSRILEGEPDSLRRWVPDLPGDLETIVGKCLEQDPERRYESALALAEDLRRFREGEAIMARRASWSYRAVRWTRRHRLLVAIGGCAALAVLAAGGWGLNASLRAHRTSVFAARFGGEAEGMASALRMACLLPRHDLRPQVQAIRLQMEGIRRDIAREGQLAEGPGAWALGRGHLTLREYAEARRELERAWALGYRDAQVAQALGQVLGELYREGLEELSQISDPAQRARQRKALARELRDPAVACLRTAAQDRPEHRSLLEADLAFYEENFSAAIAKARSAFHEDPSLYEAKLLEGNALVAQGLAIQDTRPRECLQLLHEAEVPFSVALDIGRSDPALLYAEASRRCELARCAYFASQLPDETPEALQARLDRVLAVNPDAAKVYLAKARLAGAQAIYLNDRGQDPFGVLDQAIRWCHEATRRSEGALSVAAPEGDLHRWKAICRRDRGLNPADELEAAAGCFQEAISQHPGDSWLHGRMAQICSMQVDLVLSRGGDPEPILLRGIFHTNEAIRTAETASIALSAGCLYVALGDWRRDHGRDPESAYRQAMAYYRLAALDAPADGEGQAGLADVAVRYAVYLRQVGKPAEEVLAEGLEAAERSIRLDPNYLHWLNAGDCLRMQAQLRMDRQEDPLPSLRLAADALRRAGILNPAGDYTLPWYQGLMTQAQGEAEAAARRSPLASWERAARLLARAIRTSPGTPELYEASARLEWTRAKWLRGRQPACGAAVARGLSAAQAGLGVNPRSCGLLALRGALYGMDAGFQRDPALRRNILQLARGDLERALREDPFLAREFAPELHSVAASPGAPQ